MSKHKVKKPGRAAKFLRALTGPRKKKTFDPSRRRALVSLGVFTAALTVAPLSLAKPPMKNQGEKPVQVAKLDVPKEKLAPPTGSTSATVKAEQLEEVSLDKMRRLARETELYHVSTIDNERMFSTWIDVPFERKLISAMAGIYKSQEAKPDPKLSDSGIDIIFGNKVLVGEDLAPLAELYSQRTGKEMRYVRLAVEIESTEYGPAMTVSVIPVERPNGQILSNIPMFGISYYADGSTGSGFSILR